MKNVVYDTINGKVLNPDLVKFGVNRIKLIGLMRNPYYELPPDRLIREAIEDIYKYLFDLDTKKNNNN